MINDQMNENHGELVCPVIQSCGVALSHCGFAAEGYLRDSLVVYENRA